MSERNRPAGRTPLSADRLVVRLLGIEPLTVRRTASPDAWYVDLPGERRVVLKHPGWLNRPGSTLVEAWAYRECERRNVRVPKVLAVSEDPEYLVIERLCGTSLPDRSATMTASDRAAWVRAGEDLRAIHEVRLAGFGPLLPGPDEPRGEATEWCPFAEHARTEGIRWLADAGFLSTANARGLIRRFDEAEAAFAQVTQGRLLHGDLECHHVFRSPDGGYAGLIDFGQAQAGDPRWDLARVPLWDEDEALDALLEGYGSDAVTNEDRELLLPLYRLSGVVHHAVGHDAPEYIRTLLDRSGYQALL